MPELRTYVKVDEKHRVLDFQQLYYTDEYPHEIPENMIDITQYLKDFSDEPFADIYIKTFENKDKIHFNINNNKLRILCDVDFDKWVELVSE